MTTLRAMVDRLLMEAADDWVGIWELPWMARSIGGAQDPEGALNLSLQAIRETLDNGLVEVGDVTEVGFRPWGVTSDEACHRIEREWRRFPDGPRLGDMSCWFNLTERGRECLGESGSAQGHRRT